MTATLFLDDGVSIFVKAAEDLTPDKWWRGKMHPTATSHDCLWTATRSNTKWNPETFMPLITILNKAITQVDPGFPRFSGGIHYSQSLDRILHWNDRPATTFEQLHEVLRVADDMSDSYDV